MESNIEEKRTDSKLEMKKRRFPKTSRNYDSVLFIIKVSIAGKDVSIAISLAEDKIFIKLKIATQLVILESNIIEKLDFWQQKI